MEVNTKVITQKIAKRTIKLRILKQSKRRDKEGLRNLTYHLIKFPEEESGRKVEKQYLKR